LNARDGSGGEIDADQTAGNGPSSTYDDEIPLTGRICHYDEPLTFSA